MDDATVVIVRRVAVRAKVDPPADRAGRSVAAHQEVVDAQAAAASRVGVKDGVATSGARKRRGRR